MTTSTRTIGWLDCAAGVAGDMLLGALVDIGVPLTYLQEAVSALPVEPVTLRAEPTSRHAIGATKIHVDAPPSPPHRHWSDIRQLLSSTDLPAEIIAPALDAFARIARAEAAVHRIDPDQVTFHEVGALDALADIVGSCAGTHWLRQHRGLEQLWTGPVALGGGATRAAHGAIPLPGPAVLGIVAEANLPVRGGDLPYEACTPTGAALIAALTSKRGPLPPMQVTATGAGAGSGDPSQAANLTRLVLGTPIDHHPPGIAAPAHRHASGTDDAAVSVRVAKGPATTRRSPHAVTPPGRPDECRDLAAADRCARGSRRVGVSRRVPGCAMERHPHRRHRASSPPTTPAARSPARRHRPSPCGCAVDVIAARSGRPKSVAAYLCSVLGG